jgi:hypothetical protein
MMPPDWGCETFGYEDIWTVCRLTMFRREGVTRAVEKRFARRALVPAAWTTIGA